MGFYSSGSRLLPAKGGGAPANPQPLPPAGQLASPGTKIGAFDWPSTRFRHAHAPGGASSSHHHAAGGPAGGAPGGPADGDTAGEGCDGRTGSDRPRSENRARGGSAGFWGAGKSKVHRVQAGRPSPGSVEGSGKTGDNVQPVLGMQRGSNP